MMTMTEQLTKDFILKSITKQFNFQNKNIYDWNNAKTVWKELCGYLILTSFIGSIEWVKDEDLQKHGVDFIYKDKLYDLKSLVGDYHTEEGLNIPIELKQYGKSPYDDKITDVLVYTVLETSTISIVFVDFEKLKDWVILNSDKYEETTAKNYSGSYIKVPIRDIKDFCEVKRIKRIKDDFFLKNSFCW